MSRAFLDAGANVCVIDLNREAGLSLVEELGGRLAFVEGNVTVEETWKNALAKCIELFGGVQILIVSRPGVLKDLALGESCSADFFRFQNNAGVSRKSVRVLDLMYRHDTI
jgi:NAD(P)-dependent dehydrogenase (short-subunit alcohol dehydrogenase family)